MNSYTGLTEKLEVASSARGLSYRARIVSLVLAIYAFVPTESTSEYFSLAVRITCFLALTLLAFTFGVSSRRNVGVVSIVVFGYVLVLSIANLLEPSLRYLFTCLIIGVSGGFAVFSVGSRTTNWAATIFSDLLVLSIGGVCVQLIQIQLGVFPTDIHGLLFPWSEARLQLLESYGVFRVTGIHIEPGTHSAWTVGFLILRTVYGRRLFDRVGWLSIMTVAATLSVWGLAAFVVYVFCFALSLLFQRYQVPKVYVYLIAVLFFGFGVVGLRVYIDAGSIGDYLGARAELSTESAISKIQAWEAGLEVLGDVVLHGYSAVHDYCLCRSPQDAGLVLNMAMYFGVIATAIFIIVVVFAALPSGFGGVWLVPLLLFFFLGKFSYFDPIVWMLLFLSIVRLMQKQR